MDKDDAIVAGHGYVTEMRNQPKSLCHISIKANRISPTLLKTTAEDHDKMHAIIIYNPH
jgi:hypothetical protein